MKRQVVVWIVVLTLGLQAWVATAVAATPLLPDCAASAGDTSGAVHKPCCADGSHAVNCCLDACVPVS
jgi:hypothetical protein